MYIQFLQIIFMIERSYGFHFTKKEIVTGSRDNCCVRDFSHPHRSIVVIEIR